VRSEPIVALNAVIEEYRHRVTGAQHFHIASDNNENVFLVALRTVPQDSTGVAHILEHTALCGSERYPVRDPFFMMIAAFAQHLHERLHQQRLDRLSLRQPEPQGLRQPARRLPGRGVLRAPRPLDFAQEGHRVEFATPDDPAARCSSRAWCSTR
jgi:presequence protease